MPPSPVIKPLGQRVINLVAHPQFVWWIGHVLLLYCFAQYSIGIFVLRTSSVYKWYKLAYAGCLLSYAVVLYKSYGMPKLSKEYVSRVFSDENVQYLLLAVYWYSTKPIYLTLIPYAVFSFFHTISYLRSNVIPTFVPTTVVASGSDQAPPTGLATSFTRAISRWIKANYEPAMRFVSLIEVVAIMGWVTVNALLFRISLLTPLIYAQFLRLRYYMSPHTRAAFSQVVLTMDHKVNDPRCPAAFRRGYLFVRDMVVRFGGSSLRQPGPQPSR